MALPLLALLAVAAISAAQIKRGSKKKAAPAQDQRMKTLEINAARSKAAPRQTVTVSPSRPAPAPAPRPVPAPAPVIRQVAPQAPPSGDQSALIRQVAQKYGFKPAFFAALVQKESSGNARAYRYEPHLKEGSYGLTQLLASTARELGLQGSPEQLYDPATALDYAGRYFQKRQKQYPQAKWNDPVEAYRVYNTGNPRGKFNPGVGERFLEIYNQQKGRY